MKAYKGFNQKLQCTPDGKVYQYEIGRDYEEPHADLCKNGFHACENPLDVFGYYPPADSRYCEVELGEVSDETSADSKRCAKRIHIGAEIGLTGIINAGVKFVMDKVDWSSTRTTNTGYRSAATNTGDQSAATNTGNRSAATNTGDQSAATNTGYQSAATNTGYQSAATNTGNRSAATNTGDQSAATNTGYQSAATNTGYQSAATNTGNRSAASVCGEESIAVVTGYGGKASGAIGCWLVLTERDDSMHILGVQAVCVDGRTIKPDTYYKLVNGKVVEADV